MKELPPQTRVLVVLCALSLVLTLIFLLFAWGVTLSRIVTLLLAWSLPLLLISTRSLFTERVRLLLSGCCCPKDCLFVVAHQTVGLDLRHVAIASLLTWIFERT